MKTVPALLLAGLVLVTGLLATTLRAADAPAGELVLPSDHDTAWLAAARSTYPLKTCLVSDEELGSMGKPADYIYRQSGQPDQLVRFCCKMCVRKFKQAPEKHLARLTPEDKTDDKPTVPKHH